MREYKKESELKAIASAICEKPVLLIVTESGKESEVYKKLSAKQKKLAYNVIFGTLLGLNFGEENRTFPRNEQAILDASEFTYDLIVNSALKENERVNGYISFYCPIKEALRNW